MDIKSEMVNFNEDCICICICICIFLIHTASVQLEIRGLIKSEMVTFNEHSSVSPVSVPVTPYPHFPHFLTYHDDYRKKKHWLSLEIVQSRTQSSFYSEAKLPSSDNYS